MSINSKWPKRPPELTLEQKKIKDEFLIKWHEILPNKYGMIEKFNHIGGFKKKDIPPGCRTLEVGAGLGEHIKFQNITDQDYYALELRQDMAERLHKRFPIVKTIIGDIQKRIDFSDGYFDRIIGVHVLEHLSDLPAALFEIRRLLKPNGFCEFVIPCEGGLVYSLARAISAKRIFEKTYKTSYDWCIKSEHVNNCSEIINELVNAGFRLTWMRYFPFPMHWIFCNLVVGICCYPNKI